MQSSWPCPRCGVPVASSAKFCAACGAPILWAFPTTVPPASSGSKAGVIVAVVVLFVVVLPIIVAAVLYVMVSGLIGGTGSPVGPPAIILTSQGCAVATCTAIVTEASRPIGLTEFAVNIVVNGSASTNVQGLNTLPVGGPGFRLSFVDNNALGIFDSGDQFIVEGAPGGVYELQLLWFDADVFTPVAGVVLSA